MNAPGQSAADSVPAGSGPGHREAIVGRAFVTLADTLVDDYDIIELLSRLVRFSVNLLAAEAAGIVLGDGQGRLRVVAASSEAAELMELLQLQCQEGPCLDCFKQSAPVSVPDLRDTGNRWPTFVDEVSRRGEFRSVHAIPLRLRGDAIGALNLFHREPGPLPKADLGLGQALADVATIGILSERSIRHGEVLTEQLQTALNSRVVIEQAKGVVAHHFGIDMAAAFDRIRRHARNRNARLSEVAQQVASGALGPDQLPARSRE